MTNWDSEIDSVARSLTDDEPDAALKARVLARIDRPRSSWRSAWILSPLAVAAAVVIGVMLVRLKPDPTTDTARLKPDPTTDSVVGSAFRRTDVVGSAFRPTDGVTPTTVARNDDMDSLVPPLLEIEPLGVESMDAMATIQITRLDVAPLEVPLLSGE